VRSLPEHTGKATFAKLADGGPNGVYRADQALHHLALLGGAVLVVTL
jgi:hypothetical protein